jgi:LysR family transcriptional activator of nhaA
VLNFNHVYYFHVAATEGSVKAAAERLGVTQPTVSEQIKMLERSLGLALFARTGSGLRLTDSGREAFEHTTAMFRAGERLVRALGRNTDAPPVSLRIGVSANISRGIAADFLMPVLTLDGCRPVIRAQDSLDLFRELRARELDLVISDTPPADVRARGLEVITLHRPQLVAIVAPDVAPGQDWVELSLLAHRPSSSYRWEVDSYLQERDLRPTAIAELDDSFLMLEAVARGKSVAFVPKSVARDALANKRVKVIAELPPGSAAVHALYHSGDDADLAKKAVDLLVEHAKTNFGG